jgi:L-ribulose-5-phosphate 4-epimerase
MNVKELKKEVYRANMQLQASGLVLFTFGNVSAVDRDLGIMAIKPSGVPYEDLSEDKMVCVALASGRVVDGDLNPSSDTDTHLEIYRHFQSCGGVVHTHSEFATTCAQACIPIRCMGTTHADYFFGNIPVTRGLTQKEVAEDYEKNTGRVIAETFRERNPEAIPAVLVAHHGPFVWGRSAHEAVLHAVLVEFLAKMEIHIRQVHLKALPPPQHLIEKHYLRKHGANAYYGQPEGRKNET